MVFWLIEEIRIFRKQFVFRVFTFCPLDQWVLHTVVFNPWITKNFRSQLMALKVRQKGRAIGTHSNTVRPTTLRISSRSGSYCCGCTLKSTYREYILELRSKSWGSWVALSVKYLLSAQVLGSSPTMSSLLSRGTCFFRSLCQLLPLLVLPLCRINKQNLII